MARPTGFFQRRGFLQLVSEYLKRRASAVQSADLIARLGNANRLERTAHGRGRKPGGGHQFA
jgi:hypothetical protein